MPQEEHKTVFINYRRKTSAYIARAIFEHLRAEGYDVFMDVESIDSGTFDTIILNQIKARAHFLAILSPGSLEGCDNPGDWVRREIEYAIEQGRNIVPVLTGGFEFRDYQDYLTGKLSELPRYSGLLLYHEYFDEGMTRLQTRFLKQPTTGSIQPAPIEYEPTVQRKIDKVEEQPIPTKEELTAEEYFSRGLVKQHPSDLDGAIADYNEAIRLNPQYPPAYNNRGLAYTDQGNLDRAIADFDQAIRLNPHIAIFYFNRGNARKNQDDLTGAITDYNEAIRLNPQYADAFNNRGTVYTDQGDLERAIADYNKAIQLNSQNANAHNNRGLIRFHQGDLTSAIADYDKAIQINPQYTDAYINRGTVHYLQNDLTRAIADYDAAIRLNPQYSEAYSNRGEAYFVGHQYELALIDFEKSLELKPDFIMSIAGRAITLHALGRVDEARAQWRKLIVQDNRFRDADWVGEELWWHPALVEEVRRLIESL